ncbi:thiol-disulfide oxidoreductase DCC family protein [Marinomonas spartinae]|uniref:thiol-disulfide oxidoreductase DCC family protein n=1 Tax=Marinomonas spartinae TaxID=1792290 RepID=UPI0018F2573B|nr:DUF393 domain-containing protein [Marinomonas spartinae]MBJ7555844.1 DUF393 domain-containing protein [Marinomonas spartinae]
MLIIFYDGLCPLCLAEMRELKKLDVHHRLTLENIHHEDFTQRYPHIDPIKADRILHGQLGNGKVIQGLDVTCMAWRLVGKHRWMQILRWPVIRLFADLGYQGFAKYRHSISSFITGKPRCTSCDKGECDLL